MIFLMMKMIFLVALISFQTDQEVPLNQVELVRQVKGLEPPQNLRAWYRLPLSGEAR